MTILVVESNEHVRDAIKAILETEGYEVSTASNSIEALHYLRNHSDVALVLADVMMPYLGGWLLPRTMTSDPKLSAIPILMMTGAIAEPSVSNQTPILRKPFGMQELLDAVRLELERNSGRARRRVNLREAVVEPPKRTTASDVA